MEEEGTALAAACRSVALRYRDAGRFTRRYVQGKLARDPVTAALVRIGRERSLGRVLDLGCGRGQLGLVLLEAGVARSLTGLDWDEAHLAAARAAATGLDARFDAADLRAAALPEADTVLLVDLLYQLPPPAQLELLERAAGAARQRLFARAFDPDRGWRSVVGHLAEAGITALRLYHPHAVKPVPVPHLLDRLLAAGFDARIEPCWARTPLPNVLIRAERAP
jgi:SAM-dependent methyltransferase